MKHLYLKHPIFTQNYKIKNMKTKLLLLLFTFSVLSSQAQIGVGLKLGVLATDVNVKAASSFKELEIPTARKLSYSGGMVLNYEFLPQIMGISTGIEFSQKGFNVNLDKLKQVYNDIQEVKGDWNVALQYIQMPVSMYYKLGNFNINAGPYMAYGLGGIEKYDMELLLDDGTTLLLNGSEDMIPVSGEVDADLADEGETMLINYFNKLDFGLNIGAGFTIKNMQINLQYQQGLTNITPDLVNEPDFNPADLISKNNVLSMELIYFFNFGKKAIPSNPY